jgi:hypothetical protein
VIVSFSRGVGEVEGRMKISKKAHMNRDWAGVAYTTLSVSNDKDGYFGLEMYRTDKGKKDLVAKILFWDATGQFFFETFNTDLPLSIVEELIVEAKTTIKIR